ncbi:hypothetical protein G7Z17_g10900 [Cylindrodendrum hubeiense]|uniref:Protein ORM1 n=1 Tax=Cylindrodendrum hubeiense TaxID=595255 RepID=A0A9P5L4E6_9HYPO|nr:hypothetical protein G7Z17_g10900 [Cylindrodendrum hubeiense]
MPRNLSISPYLHLVSVPSAPSVPSLTALPTTQKKVYLLSHPTLSLPKPSETTLESISNRQHLSSSISRRLRHRRRRRRRRRPVLPIPGPHTDVPQSASSSPAARPSPFVLVVVSLCTLSPTVAHLAQFPPLLQPTASPLASPGDPLESPEVPWITTSGEPLNQPSPTQPRSLISSRCISLAHRSSRTRLVPPPANPALRPEPPHSRSASHPVNTAKLSSPILLQRTVSYDAGTKPARRGSIYLNMPERNAGSARRRRSSSILQVYHEPPETLEQISDQAALPNLNANWTNAKGAWTIHIVLIACLKIFYDIIPGVSQETSWTLTNMTYMFGSYLMFHYVRGVPFEFNSGAFDNLNMWEQIDNGAQYTPTKKFLLGVPISLFLLSTHYTHYDLAYFIINFLAVLAVVIPKLPFVRLRSAPVPPPAALVRHAFDLTRFI